MIWFFDKDGERLRYEITHDRATGKYRVIVDATATARSPSKKSISRPI